MNLIWWIRNTISERRCPLWREIGEHEWEESEPVGVYYCTFCGVPGALDADSGGALARIGAE